MSGVFFGVFLLSTSLQAETFYFHNDHLGTPQVLTDSDGAVVWQGSYSPFGEVDETTSTVEQNIRFPGQYFEEETGLHYNYFRDYDPGTGRYVESDPIGLGGGVNTFGYVGGNPVNGFDLLGLLADCVSFIVDTDPNKDFDIKSEVVFSQLVPVPFPMGVTVGMNLNPSKPTQRPLSPDLEVEWWFYKYVIERFEKYMITSITTTFKYFCKETVSDECGNEKVLRTNGTYTETTDPVEILIDSWTESDWKRLE